jgi:hypothetical protein
LIKLNQLISEDNTQTTPVYLEASDLTVIGVEPDTQDCIIVSKTLGRMTKVAESVEQVLLLKTAWNNLSSFFPGAADSEQPLVFIEFDPERGPVASYVPRGTSAFVETTQ